MTNVGRYDDRGGGAGHPEQVVPAGLAELLADLAGPRDFWDRPGGDFGPLTGLYALSADTAQRVNSLYRLGTKALRRGELGPATESLGAAAESGHPGALFKMAALASRAAGSRHEDVRFLVAEAARHGHGDARRLLSAAAHPVSTAADDMAAREDPEFFDEVRAALKGLPARSSPGLEGQLPDLSASGPGGAPSVPSRLPVSRQGTKRRSPAQGPTGCVSEVGQERVADTAVGRGSRPNPASAPGNCAEPGRQRLRQDAAAPARPYVGTGRTGPPAAASTTGLWAPPRGLWTPPASTPKPEHQPREWESALRVLDVLHLIHGSDSPVTDADAARAAGVTTTAAAELMAWLSDNSLTAVLPDGTYTAGPLMQATERGEDVLQQVLDQLREDTGAAVYVSAYTDGELTVTHASYTADTPKVDEYVPFRECAHASAVGKSILSQLTTEARKDHLSRWRPYSLTARTITDPQILFRNLDKHGPTGSHFDVMEYCDSDVCAAISLPLPGQARCVALSLPIAQRHRLTTAAHTLSSRSTGLLLAVITAALPLRSTANREHASQSATPPDDPARTSRLGTGLFLPPRLHDRLLTPARLFIGRP